MAALLAGGLAAPAALATPGVPDAPVALFSENFENVPDAFPQLIQDYTGALPVLAIYSADDGWIGSQANCNGLVVSFNGNPSECPFAGGDASIKAAASKLGTFAGAASPADNHAIGESGNAAPASGDVELQFAEGLELTGASGRFLVAGVDAAVFDCAIGAPLFSFEINPTRGSDPPVEGPLIGLSPAPQDACVQGGDLGDGFRGGRIYSDAAVLADFDTFNLFVRNANTDVEGSSYHGLDNLVVADATPALDQSFASATATTGSTVNFTLTITNTSDLASKQGWSFTGDLPAGLQVSSGATAASAARVGLARATSCPGTTVTATAGGQRISAQGGLATDQVSCTVTIGVTSSGPGAFTVPATSLSRVGLRAPGPATVTFADPAAAPPPPPPPPPATPAACADGRDNDGDGLVDAADPGCVLGGVYQPQKDSEANIAALAQCANGALQLTDVFGRDGRTVLRGVAGPDHVGKRVSLVATWGKGRTVATAVVKGDLSFATTAPLPPRSIRNTNAARYRAQIGAKHSLSLKFARRMTETVASRVGATKVKIGGRVTKPFALPRARILVRAASSCQSSQRFRGLVVARNVKLRANGAWSATITLPAALRTDKVYLRATTNVRQTTASRKTFATFTLIQGVTLK